MLSIQIPVCDKRMVYTLFKNRYNHISPVLSKQEWWAKNAAYGTILLIIVHYRKLLLIYCVKGESFNRIFKIIIKISLKVGTFKRNKCF